MRTRGRSQRASQHVQSINTVATGTGGTTHVDARRRPSLPPRLSTGISAAADQPHLPQDGPPCPIFSHPGSETNKKSTPWLMMVMILLLPPIPHQRRRRKGKRQSLGGPCGTTAAPQGEGVLPTDGQLRPMQSQMKSMMMDFLIKLLPQIRTWWPWSTSPGQISQGLSGLMGRAPLGREGVLRG